MSEQPKQRQKQLRTVEVKVRLTPSEHMRMLELSDRAELARWVRETCLGAGRRTDVPPPTVAPALLRQLVGLGNNLNQLARAANRAGPFDQVRILAALAAIERELADIRERHSRPRH